MEIVMKKHIIKMTCDVCNKSIDVDKSTQISIDSELDIKRSKCHKVHVWNAAMDDEKDLCPACANKILKLFNCYLVD
jgi:hypothetical protein